MRCGWFRTEHRGWNYTYSPCHSFNLPADPHLGHGDHCAYVALCKSKKNKFYTMGIHGTAVFHLMRNVSFRSPDLTPGQSVVGQAKNDDDNDDDDDDDDGDDDDDEDKDEDEDEDEDDEDDEDTGHEGSGTNAYPTTLDSAATVEVIFRGIKSLAQRPSHVILTCDRSRARHGNALFHLINDDNPRVLIFELRHICCCPDACVGGNITEMTGLSTNDPSDPQPSQARDVPRLLWLVVVVNGVIIAIAVVICRLCSYQGVSSDSPYNYLPDLFILKPSRLLCDAFCHHLQLHPALHGSRVTLHSEESYVPPQLTLKVKSGKQVEKLAGVSALNNCTFSQYDLKFKQRLGGGTFCDTYLADYKKHHLAAKRITVGVHKSQLTPNQSSWLLDEIKFLSTERHCTAPVIDKVSSMEIMEELDNEPKFTEMEAVVARLSNNKASGRDAIPADLIKAGRQVLLSPLYSLLLKWCMARHQSLVRVLGVCLDAREPYILTEFVDGESLKDLLNVTRQTSHQLTRNIDICIQVAEGMAYLHSAKPPILHRDLRSANILVSINGKAKVVDFGHTRLVQRFRQECDRDECFCNKPRSAIPASLRWTAPEILRDPTADESNSEVFTPSCDVYSYGMVLWEIVTSAIPFYDIDDECEVMEQVIKGSRPPTDIISKVPPEYLSLMEECCDEYPDQRPKFQSLLSRLKVILQSLCKETASKRSLGDSHTMQYLRSAFNLDQSFD
ncbi:hypothetical protein LSAT2_026224 [Lamellibrachia satsuma]|nr:hypothetical protein LSAT2_026224 [Lamellibrachia satsuma]